MVMQLTPWIALASGLTLAGAALLARRRLVAITVRGRSMEPTLYEGDRVLVLRRPLRRVRRGEIVVFEEPRPELRWGHLPAPAHRTGGREWLIKRAVALPGDPVPAEVASAVSVAEGAPVPADSLVVIGDGTRSGDSRLWGFVPGDRLLGVAMARLPGGRT
jgi:signal peptidase I